MVITKTFQKIQNFCDKIIKIRPIEIKLIWIYGNWNYFSDRVSVWGLSLNLILILIQFQFAFNLWKTAN